jgi:ComF family protein
MLTRLRQIFASSLDLFLPPACLLCGQTLSTLSGPQAFCEDCLAAVTPLGRTHCNRCAQPFPNSPSSHLCGTCLKRPPAFSMVYAASLYQGSIKEAIHRMKYRNQLTLARHLGQLLITVFDAAEKTFAPDIIVPVPLHPDRLRQRGYNQAVEIARPIAQRLNVPLNSTLLRRIRITPQQQGLTAAERRSNLRKAFAVTTIASAHKVLLIDDVMTTGETVRECCRTLLAGGVEEVQVAVVARA